MNIIADLHTHTLSSGHAIATLGEMIIEAERLEYKAFATTDHAASMPGSPAPYYFSNLLHMPDVLDSGIILLKGAEVNIMTPGAKLDMPEKLLAKLDWVVASIHAFIMEEGFSQSDTPTDMWLRIAENPFVDMIGHSEQEEFCYDYARVTKVFAQKNKVVEMNAGSATARPGNEGNMKKLALCCKESGTRIAVTSDAHSTYQMRNMRNVIGMLEEIQFPEELIINTTLDRLFAELKLHNRDIARRVSFAP